MQLGLSLTFVCVCWTVSGSTLSKNSHLFDNCQSVQVNPFTYKFNVWILVPFESKYKFAHQRIKPAIERALNDSWNDASQVHNWNISALFEKSAISVVYQDTKCDPDWTPLAASDIHDVSLLEHGNVTGNSTLDIDAIIGLTCDITSGRVAPLANHWSWPLIFPGVRTATYDKKKGLRCCSTMVRPGITAADFGSFMISLFKRYDWNTSAIVFTYLNGHGASLEFKRNTDCGTLLRGVTNAFNAVGWTRIRGDYEIIDHITDTLMENSAEEILKDRIRKFARVSMWCIGRRAMRKVMLVADKLNMTTGEYVFIYLDLYNSNTSYVWTDDDDMIEHDTSKTDDSKFTDPHTDEYLRALTVVSLHTPTNAEYKQFSDSVKQELNSTSNGTVIEYNEYVNPFISYYYDSMRLFIFGLLRTICNGSNQFDNGEEFISRLWGIEYESLGRNITISKRGDQEMNYSVLDMNNKTKKFEVVLTYHSSTGTFEELGSIDWPGSVVPLNMPLCGYENEHCQVVIEPDRTVYYVLGGCAGLLLAGCAAIFIMYKLQVC